MFWEFLWIPRQLFQFLSVFSSFGGRKVTPHKLQRVGIEINMKTGYRPCFTLGFFKPCIVALQDDSDGLLKTSQIHLSETLLFTVSTHSHWGGPCYPLNIPLWAPHITLSTPFSRSPFCYYSVSNSKTEAQTYSQSNNQDQKQNTFSSNKWFYG